MGLAVIITTSGDLIANDPIKIVLQHIKDRPNRRH